MKSIRRDLTVGLLWGFALLLGLAGTGLYFSTRHVLVSEFDYALKTKALAMASLAEQSNDRIEMDFAEEFMPEFERRKHGDFFQLRLANGRTIERSRSLGKLDLPAKFGSFREPALWNLELPNGKPGRAVGISFPAREENHDDERPTARGVPVTLVVARDRSALDHTLSELAALLAVIGFIITVGVILLVKFVVRKGLAPLEEVADRSAQINASSLHVRFAANAMPQEVQPICERLNDLLSRLETAFMRERRFTSDVAHELRTPVAELRSLAEVALKWPEADSTESFRDALDISKQMETIVTSLLAVARCEGGHQAVQPEPIPLAALVEELWQPLAHQAAQRDLAVTFDIPSGLLVHADRILLGVILNNLLSNAAEYADPTSPVRIAAQSSDTQVTLTIANAATDLDQTDVAHLFDRFWRKDAVRTSSAHSGLGLSIAAEFATLLKTPLTARITDASILDISLVLPALPDDLAESHPAENSSLRVPSTSC